MTSQSYPRLQFIFFSLFLCLFITPAAPHGPPSRPHPGPRRTCTVETHPNNTDDAPAIIRAFEECGHGGQVVFLNQTYHVNSVMNTTGLEDCEIDLHGTLLWGTNITYWLNHSLPIGYQNQTSAWFLGGDRLVFRGYGYGTLDGNGQVWYNFVNGQSNYPGRPHALTIWETTDSIFDGLRFVQSQMWTMEVMHSERVLLSNIYVNSTSNSHAPARNTDGADTIYSDSITFDHWTVVNGDDSISIKANSTNIVIKDSTFINGLGVSIGSIGQYKGVFEYIENVTVTGNTCYNTRYAAYVKTWTGQQVNYPPNGGGGGLGYASNLTFTDFTMHNTTGTGVFYITQCTTFSGVAGDCNSSLFNLRNIQFTNSTGFVGTSYVAYMQCSADSPCTAIEISNIDLTKNGTLIDEYHCSNVEDEIGFSC